VVDREDGTALIVVYVVDDPTPIAVHRLVESARFSDSQDGMDAGLEAFGVDIVRGR
jgi:hypothetical protein